MVENVRCDNFVIENAADRRDRDHDPLLPGPRRALRSGTPVFRNFAFSNLTIINAHQVASIIGLPEKAVEGLRFTDIAATGQAGFLCDLANGVELHHVRVDAATGGAFGFRAVRRLVLDDVTSGAPSPAAPVIRLADTDSVWLRGSQAAPGTGTFLRVDGARPASLRLTDNDLSAAAQPTDPAGW